MKAESINILDGIDESLPKNETQNRSAKEMSTKRLEIFLNKL